MATLAEEGAALLGSLRPSSQREERVLALLAAAMPPRREAAPRASPPARGASPSQHAASPQRPASPSRPRYRAPEALFHPDGGVCDDLALALVEERVHWRAEAARIAEETARLNAEREALAEASQALQRGREALHAEAVMERAAMEARCGAAPGVGLRDHHMRTTACRVGRVQRLPARACA
jgi:hypothetical protein